MEAAAQEQTALVVEVPAAEAAVAHWRRRHDRAARAGVPAHVTVCFPFLPPQALDDDVEDALTALAAATPASTLAFSRVDGSGDAVMWLAPEPAEPLRALTRAVCAAFGLLPYGGAHGGIDDAVPHLTGRRGRTRPGRGPRRPGAALPVTQHVRELTLLQGTFAPDGWRVRRRFPLGQGTGTGPS